MAPKKSSAAAATPPPPKPVPSHARAFSSTSSSTPSSKPSSTLSSKSSPQEVALYVWNQYLQNTPSRTLLLDAFMAFLVLVGGIQFLYAIVGGNYVRSQQRPYHLQPVSPPITDDSSPSTPSSPASLLPSASSSSPLHYACRQASDRPPARRL
jgi:hypothetical protein